jgi:hypothetical protein
MAITTSANVKTILGISGSTQDANIALLIPQVEADYLAIRNKPWDTEIEGERVGIGDGSAVAFTLANKPIVKDSLTVYVGGDEETGYTVNLTTGVITFTTAPAAGDRVEADYESVAAFYPGGAELVAIKMIGWLIQSQKSMGVQSESLGDHSITYEKGKTFRGYPESIVGDIKRYASFAA